MALGKKLDLLNGDGLKLQTLGNRGEVVYPEGFGETFCTDHWRGRFFADQANGKVSHQQIISLLSRMEAAGFDFIKTEHLYTFDGANGFT